MALKKVTLKDSDDYNGQFSYAGSVRRWKNGTAVMPEDEANKLKDGGYDVDINDYDPDSDNEALTSYYYYRMDGHDAAKEKENLSLDNVADAHTLAARRFSEPDEDDDDVQPYHFTTRHVNNWDSTVKIVPPLTTPAPIPDDELYRGVPISTADEKVKKVLEERGSLAKKHADKLREAYEGSNPARDESLERGQTVRAPLDNLRTANPAQKRAIEKNETLKKLVEYGPDAVGAATADEAEEEVGGVPREMKEENAEKFAESTVREISDSPLYEPEQQQEQQNDEGDRLGDSRV